MIQYRSLNSYLRERFGQKVYKIAIDAGFTCPNRDGTKGTRGCIFCSGQGSGDFSESSALCVTEQIEKGKMRIAAKMPKHTAPENQRYIAYFQAFTNTYGTVEHLQSLYMEAIGHPEVVAISIGTRPDCLSEPVLDLLETCNKIKPVWVELGLQTIHESTARYIRRGYPLSVYEEAVRNLKVRNLEVITHVILGLPGESREAMLDTVRYVAGSGCDGVKLQLLHVIEGTDLAEEYRAGKFRCMEQEEYIDLLVECLKLIPKDMVIHRLTGDGDKKTLVAPLWSADKKRVLNGIQRKIRDM